MIDSTHLTAFRDMLGARGVIEPGVECASYETPARYAAGKAACVLRPASTTEVSQAVAYCVRHGIAFVPQSGATGLTNASTPDPSGDQVVLSLDRLTAPLEVSPADRTVTAGAGVRLSTLNAALEPHGLFLPIDLGADPMIGGMVATNTGGARFLRYGDMRRQVIGLEVVLADDQGTVLDLTSRLRKDNTSLGLKHLFIGSSGAFGVVTKAVLEVQPRPACASTALLLPRDEDAVLEILAALETRLADHLSAFEGMSAAALAHAFEHSPRLRNPFPGAALPPYLVLVEASSCSGPIQDRLVEAVSELAADETALVRDALFDDGDRFWAIRHSISEGLRAAGRVIGLDLSFARSDVMSFCRTMRTEMANRFPELEVCDFGHVADGGVHFNLLARIPDLAAECAEAAKRYVIERAVRDFAGSFSGEHGLGPAVQTYYDDLAPERLKRYADQIQAALGVRSAARVRFGF